MGNRPSRDDNSTPDNVPLTLISTAEGSFGVDGLWKPNALLAILETLFRVPCLGECILGAQIDQKCSVADHNAIYELQLLFDARANSPKGAIIPTDQFLGALMETHSATNVDSTDTKIFDDNDPSQVYSAISDLIISSLPELRGIFYDRNDYKLLLKKDIQPKPIKTNGICISLVPYFEVNVGNEIISLKLPRPKIRENTPIFVVTTAYPLVTTMGQKARYPISCYSLAFPTSLNLMKLTPPTTDAERCDLVYQLHSVVAELQGPNGTRQIKSFYRTGPDPNAWCESAAKPIPRNLTDLQALGAPRSNSCVRVLIYIQTDLSLMTSSHLPLAGMKIFKEGSTNPKLNSSCGIPILQQIIGISGSLSPGSPTSPLTVATCAAPKGIVAQSKVPLKTISNGVVTPIEVTVAASILCESHCGQPMEEEQEEDDEIDDEDEEEDDEYEYESDGDEDDYDSENYESPEYEDESPTECQCPTCRRERDQKLRQLARLKSEKELLEQVKKEKLRRLMTPKTPGTCSVNFQPTIVKDAERVTIDGKSMVRDIVLQTITAMEGYSTKSNEELRYEDYYLSSTPLLNVKKALDEEVLDRFKEATNCCLMEKEDKSMKIWCQAADRAWAKYTAALGLYRDGLREEASELFTLALRICYAGPHSVFCYYYRALCGYPKESEDSKPSVLSDGCTKEFSNVCADLAQCIALEPDHSEAHYLLGSILLKTEPTIDWEKAELHLEKSFQVDPSTFEGPDGSGRMTELVRCREGAAHTRLVNAAEAKKTIGNAALARGAFTEAERLYTVAIEICADCEKSHIYYCNRAAARCEIGMRLNTTPDIAVATLMGAVADCDKSIELQPGYAKAVFRRLFCFGVASFIQNDLEDSLKHFGAALDLDPSNALVKQEMRKVATAIDVIKAKERVIEIEREVAAREALRAEEKEKEKRALESKKAREELIRKGKVEKLEQERIERAKIKAEREMMKTEKGKVLAEEEEKEKEEKKMEKEKQRLARELEKSEEREKKRIEREREKQKAKEFKDMKDKEALEAEDKERARKREFAMEMNRVKSVIVASSPASAYTNSLVTASSIASTSAAAAAATSTSTEDPSSGHTGAIKESMLSAPASAVNAKQAMPDLSELRIDSSVATGAAAASALAASKLMKAKPLKGSVTSLLETEIKAKIPPAVEITPVAVTAPVVKKSMATMPSIIAAASSSSKAASEKAVVAVVVPPASTMASASKALLAATAGTGTSITRIMECPQTRVGIVIGTKGSVIMEMMKKTSCKIVINQEFPDGVAREIIFSGTKEQIEAAKVLVNAVIVHGPIILANVELLNQAAAAAAAIANPPVSTASGVLHARQVGTTRVTQASAQLIRTNNIGVPGMLRMEPSGGLGDRDATLSLEEKERRVRKMMMTTPILTHQFDESDTLCVICAEPFRDGERILAFGACNHKGPCSICTVRMRAVGGDFSCALCRQDMGCVVCTTRDVPFRDFNLPGNPSPDLIYLTKGRIFLPKVYYHTAVAPLFEFRCRECKEAFNDGDLLRSHYESVHSLIQCVLCAHFKQAFPSEQAVYTVSEYERHTREGSSDGSDGQGHPECAFCQVRFYDKTELYRHVTKSHQTCHLCSRDGTQYKYYRDYKMLEDHFRKEHFACDEYECVEKRNVVFKSLFDLQAHKRSAHSQAVPSIMSEGIIGGEWDFPSLQGSSTSGQSHAQSLAATLRRNSGPGSVGKAAESFSSPEAFPSLGSTKRSATDHATASSAASTTASSVSAVLGGTAAQKTSTTVTSGLPLPPMTIAPRTSGSNLRGYDDHSDTGFDYSSASLSLNATAAPYAPANPPPPPMGLAPPSAAMGEYQGGDYGSPRPALIQSSPHKPLFGNIPSLIPLSDSSRLPVRHQSPSIGDLTSMLSGITSQPPAERSNSFSLTNQFSQAGTSSLSLNDYFSSPNPSSRNGLVDFGGGLGGAFSSSSFPGMIGGAREEGQSQMFSLPYSDLSGFGAIGGSLRTNASRLPVSLLHDDDDDDDDEGVFSDDFQMKMLTEDDEDEKIEVSLGAYRAGQLTYEKIMDLIAIACDDYDLDATCRAYFYDSPIEKQIAVLASLTSVPPGLRANENSFVKTSFQNMALHPSSRPTAGSLPNALMGGSLSLASHEYETDGQDSFFADISSLSSSLMVKDGSTDNNDMRPILPLGSAQKVSGGSYDSLLMGNGIGLEGSGHLLLSLGGGEYPRGQSLSSGDLSPTPLRILKRPVPATGPPSESSAGGSTDDPDEAAALLAAQHERSQFPPEFINKLVAVLKKYGSHGLLGSQFPDVYKKLYGEKLVLENKKGRKLKLIHVLDGHPNVRKEKLGTYKWYYKESVVPPGVPVKTKAATKAAAKAAKLVTKGGQVSPPVTPTSYSGSPGIEVDLLPADSFPCVAWLREEDMHMYRWAGNAKEWTEYAMRLRPDIATALEGTGSDILTKLRRQSGCAVSVGSDMLNGKTEKFLVFVRGDSGQPSNGAMTMALELFSQLLRTDFLVPPDSSFLDEEEEMRQMGVPSEGRIQKVLEIPSGAVSVITGKSGKLYAMRKQSGAYIALISKNKTKGQARLTISGTAAAVESALAIVTQALAEYEADQPI